MALLIPLGRAQRPVVVEGLQSQLAFIRE